jgi:hypothetical protein
VAKPHSTQKGAHTTPLRQRMIEDMRVRNLALTTHREYIRQVAESAKYFGKSPSLLGPEEVRAYQVHLVNDKKRRWSTFNVAVCALSFLYSHTLHLDWAFCAPYSKESLMPKNQCCRVVYTGNENRGTT